MYDFTEGQDRRGTNCAKWDSRLPGQEQDVLPMWVADMDFSAPPEVVDALVRRAQHGVYGYDFPGDACMDAILSWQERRHDFHVEKEWVCYTAGVVQALHLAVRAATDPGDEVLVFSPVYAPFYGAVQEENRILKVVPLQENQGYYTMDLQAIRNAITPKTRAILLCSPHNPCGRVWTLDELKALDELCQAYHLIVIADEIHNDLILQGAHTVYANVSSYAREHTIVCTAPSKTFNMAGLRASYMIIPNSELRRSFQKETSAQHIEPTCFVGPAVTAAYQYGEPWLDALLDLLRENARILKSELNGTGISAPVPEGTYLVWLDCRQLGKNPEELDRWFLQECRIRCNGGTWFGENGAGFQRINIACPTSRVQEACRRIRAAL